MRKFPAILAVFVAAGVGLTAQTFDAASVKVTKAGVFGRGFMGLQPGRFVANEATARELIAIAYGVTSERVVDGPGWARSIRYDITATFPGEATPERALPMLRQLLADRFGLRTRREQRDTAVYAMRLARSDGTLGPKLRRSGADCAPLTPPTLDGGVPPPPPPPPPGATSMRPLRERTITFRCPTMFFRGPVGGASARAVPISELAWAMFPVMDRPVVDQTGLTGEFDIDLAYQSDLSPTATGAGPSIFSALQEQLGLKLEPVRLPFDVVVIDGISPPTEN